MSREPKKATLGQKQRTSKVGNAAAGKKVGRIASTGQFTGLPKNLQDAAARVTSSRASSIEFLKKGGFLTPEGKPSPAYTSKGEIERTSRAKKK